MSRLTFESTKQALPEVLNFIQKPPKIFSCGVGCGKMGRATSLSWRLLLEAGEEAAGCWGEPWVFAEQKLRAQVLRLWAQCCRARRTRTWLVSWIELKKRWVFYLWSFLMWDCVFLVFVCFVFLFSFSSPPLSNLQHSKCPVHWQQRQRTSSPWGLLCRAWAPGDPSFQIPYKHEQSFLICRVPWVQSFSFTWAYICHALSMRRSPCG